MLEAARQAGIRHLQVSTDEVYGSIESGSFSEDSPLEPSSPYSASKAGGDLIVGAYRHTYGTDALIVRGSNNYGPRQHPEKLIPLCILNALAGDPLPVYGDGMQVRNWIFVEDFCAAIDLVLGARRGGPGLQRRRARRAAEHRGGEDDPRAHRPGRVADRVRHRPPRPRPPLLAVLGQGSRPRLGAAALPSPTACDRPSTGTATTNGGGAPCAPASTASTTSASTAAPSADGSPPRDAARRPRPDRARGPRRRRGFLVETSAMTAGASSGSRSSSSGEPLPLRARHPARAPLPDHPRPGQARPLPAGKDLGRRRGPAA